MILGDLDGPNQITGVLMRWRGEESESERAEMLGREVGGCSLKRGEDALRQRMQASPRCRKKQRNGFSPGASGRTSPSNPFQPSETHFGLLTSRTIW